MRVRSMALEVKSGVVSSSATSLALATSPKDWLKSPIDFRSLPSTPGSRRSLPGTPRNLSPRPYLPDLDEHHPSSPSSSSSSDHSPRRHQRRRYQQRKGDSLRDSLLDSYSFNNNIIREDECEAPSGCLRSFALRHGELVDRGFQRQSPNGCVHIAKRESRRATCPDILLFPENGRLPPCKVLLRIYGAKNSGKKTIAHRIQHHATYTCPEQVDVEKENEKVDNPVKFLLNEQEMQMEVLVDSALESAPFHSITTIFAVVYNVDSRESFHHAAQMLSRICRHRSHSSFMGSKVRVILVGNKIDLKRNQVVSSIEGRSLGKIYKCSFVEISALLSMNVDELWVEVLKLLQVIF
ncbi:hypothetical protein WR25_13211 isoform B [Diploscapter pachys]|uniref:Uncharacterized protein n=1 Tax=Diploscapter pachys TaxID=2018661 RepID=A0A2A2L5L4_9BILA|nr:hypothetical protein WR25_13211 isoform B [Diploscapter pachys]